jgi:hypothetical protein
MHRAASHIITGQGVADRLEALYDSGTWTDVDMVVESMKIFDSSLNHYTAYGNRSAVPHAARYCTAAGHNMI